MGKVKDKLKHISLFEGLKDDPEAIARIADIINIKEFLKGSHIIREGDKGDEMFILSEGSVRVEKTTMHDDTYTVVKLEASQNVFFGEMALIDNDVRSASVTADTYCQCYLISKEDFQKLAEENHTIGYFVNKEIATILSRRLRKSDADTITLFEALVSEIEELE